MVPEPAATIAPMTTRLWDRAGARSIAASHRLLAAGAALTLPEPEIAALPADRPPTVPELFDFMRDAELRFRTLRLEIEETTRTAVGEEVATIETFIRHPGHARITRRLPEPGPLGSVEIWCSDGETVRTYASRDRRGAVRPLRRGVVGLDDPDLPGMARVYVPITPLAAESLPELFVHPAGYCQNVLATGCAHPRTIERVADRPDFRIELAVDAATGIVTRLVESMGGTWTRWAEVVRLEPDAVLPPTAFDFEFPDGTTIIY
jgi:hypothetical protein